MRKYLVAITALALVAVLAAGCSRPPADSQPTSTGEEVNFRLLLSDEVNGIVDFASCNVTVSKIRLHRGGESGNWTDYDIDPPRTEDLTGLVGANATEIWSGYVTPGNYTKVFIYVDHVKGVLKDGNETNVKLPSNKLQVSKPFTISEEDGNLVVNFVFDITVHKAGKSGMYILHPQIAESGPDKDFVEVTRPESAGKPEGGGGAEVEIEGTIDSFTEDSVTVNGTIVLIDEDTEIEGTLAEGAEAKVEAIATEEGLLALKIEVEPG